MNDILHIFFEGQHSAVLITSIPHKQHQMFKATLESGYNNVFFTDVETGQWVEEDLGFTDLAKLLGNELKCSDFKPFHVPKMLTWHRYEISGKPASFGFCAFLNGDQKMFEIYNSNKKYMYTLVELHPDEWQILSNNYVSLDKIDNNFIQRVTKVLPLYAY